MSLSGDSFLNQGMNGPEAEVLDVQVCATSQGRGLRLMEAYLALWVRKRKRKGKGVTRPEKAFWELCKHDCHLWRDSWLLLLQSQDIRLSEAGTSSSLNSRKSDTVFPYLQSSVSAKSVLKHVSKVVTILN